MELKTLCSALSLPEEVVCQILSCDGRCEERLLRQLTCPRHSRAAYGSLAALVDPEDMGMLACQLRSACLTYERYRKRGIPDSVFYDTMGCYRRFLGEAYAMYGIWKFDRAWWTWRQLSMRLFRIGQLEYEILYEKRVICLHIPSDAVISEENLHSSLKEAKAFFREFYPKCRSWPFVCGSWLLSPELKKLLPDSSNIRRFQKRFLLLSRNPDAKDHMQWLFAVGEDAPLQTLPEGTSLRKNAKAHLLRGGKIGTALGILIKY